ncbi:cobyric acid synthase [Alicyclobacillus sp. SP_1]|uniref:cobyric acid synthase n=1 Tax=Alicyclobacillus sp. SP_1 TaxID=2942475 RepID=UPI0021574A38|nr:cobyric acid synthase [Alicyclobacillus sp. SP_1]
MNHATVSKSNIMLVGTASSVGKSVLCTALCRVLCDDGLRVVPFKAQNMSLNSAVTPSGREIGRAQALQAAACRTVPTEHMNPVLLKPQSGMSSQVVVQGVVHSTQTAKSYFANDKAELWKAIVDSFQVVSAEADVVVLEGAGSPVELNLKARDVANFRSAEMADAAVLLVVDVDRGGVFAAALGTLWLLSEKERSRVKGILVNRFRGDPSLFTDGVRILEDMSGLPVLGVIPYVPDLELDEEDSVSLDNPRYRPAATKERTLRIAIVRLPHLANFTDFDPLFSHPLASTAFVTNKAQVASADVVILPGSKSTLEDLAWLNERGLADAIRERAAAGSTVFGICGGFQMLGQEVVDRAGVESSRLKMDGLGLLPLVTEWSVTKRTVQVCGEALGRNKGLPLQGYEIHMGITRKVSACESFALVRDRRGEEPVHEEGASVENGRICGTYLHGVFDSSEFLNAFLETARERAFGTGEGEGEGEGRLSSWSDTVFTGSREERLNAEIDRMAAVFRSSVDMSKLYEVCGLLRLGNLSPSE